jgi:DNA-binding NarL/FixJ family response regulator
MKVLVADNSALVRERLVALLSELETIDLVRQASEAAQMLRSVQEIRPDVVILDDQMIGHDGHQVLAGMKAGFTPPVILILSPFSYPQYRKKCEQLGADLFLDKGIEIHRVVEVIAALGDKRYVPPVGQTSAPITDTPVLTFHDME